LVSSASARLTYLAAAALVLLAGTARATEEANIKIPPNPWGCQLCHGGPSVTPEVVPPAEIVPFTELGLEWAAQADEEADRLWSILALGNVDGDGCSNGFELGDPGGTYLPENGPAPDRSTDDPLVNDCILPISEDSWSRLKSLFDGS
jgi:hypothetical protein